jgi:hypothetical protein
VADLQGRGDEAAGGGWIGRGKRVGLGFLGGGGAGYTGGGAGWVGISALIGPPAVVGCGAGLGCFAESPISGSRRRFFLNFF